MGTRVIGLDAGAEKERFVLGIGAEKYVDITSTKDPIAAVHGITNGGAQAVVVTAGHPKAYAQAAEMLRIGGTLSCVGIAPNRAAFLTPVSTFVIKGLRVMGNLVGSLKENLDALEFVRRGAVKPHTTVRPFKDLPQVYEELEEGKISGRVVLKIADEAPVATRSSML